MARRTARTWLRRADARPEAGYEMNWRETGIPWCSTARLTAIERSMFWKDKKTLARCRTNIPTHSGDFVDLENHRKRLLMDSCA